MDDLDQSILDAWHNLRPRLRRDPTQLARRLARRGRPSLSRPPRAWCLAVRASDTRIKPWNAAISTDFDFAHRNRSRIDLDQLPPDHHPQQVTLDAPLLRLICTPVRIPPGGEDWCDVARRLGRHPESLRYAIQHGMFTVRHVPRLGGKRGKPVPILSSSQVFDPAANFSQPPDPLWGTLWQHLADRLPDNLDQTLTRIANFRYYPASGPKNIRQALARPWSNASEHDALPSEVVARFRGWRWICPGCRIPARTIFFPLPIFSLLDFLDDKWLKRSLAADAETGTLSPLPTFACTRCHRVRCFSRIDRNSWNHFITHLTAGLLYGEEVPKPAWLVPVRKRRYVAKSITGRASTPNHLA